MGTKKKMIAGLLATGLVLGGSVGVYAGTVIERYKTPRGNIATVETENVHKNRIGITVNGEVVKTDTVYFNNTTYAPIRDVATMLNAGMNYNAETMSADIFTESDLLSLFGIQLNKKYTAKERSSGRYFTMTSFNPSSHAFTGIFEDNYGEYPITGYLTEKKMVWQDGYSEREYIWDGATSTFVESEYDFKITIE